MKKKEKYRDKRVKRKIFPVSTFLVTLFVFAGFTTLQMKIIGEVIDAPSLPKVNQLSIFFIWFLAAAVFTLWTSFLVYRCYQKPVEEFSEAAHKVASGDFSVYLAPKHRADQATHLDVLFEDFNTMVAELGSIETLKTDFFSNVSHEIKTPIAVIQSNAEMLNSDRLTEEQRKESAAAILHATTRLSNLITNMLKLNKLEKQTIKPVPQVYDLCAQLCDCALQFEETWEKKEIEFIPEIEDRALVMADKELMELVWTNLLSNAMKFTPSGGTVTLTQISEEREIIISVTDTGCGMDQETIRHIYDKFYQGDTSHATEGNGLGLALVQRILQLNNGTIAVTSAPGAGSRFTVILPAVDKEEQVE